MKQDKYMVPYDCVVDAVERWQKSRKLSPWILPKYVYMSKSLLEMDNRTPLPKTFGPPMLNGCLVKVVENVKEPICYVKDGPMIDWKNGRELPEGWVGGDDELDEDDETDD